MLAASYPTKKALAAAIGQPLRYVETSLFGPEFTKPGTFPVVGPSPTQRNWYATVEVDAQGVIVAVDGKRTAGAAPAARPAPRSPAEKYRGWSDARLRRRLTELKFGASMGMSALGQRDLREVRAELERRTAPGAATRWVGPSERENPEEFHDETDDQTWRLVERDDEEGMTVKRCLRSLPADADDALVDKLFADADAYNYREGGEKFVVLEPDVADLAAYDAGETVDDVQRAHGPHQAPFNRERMERGNPHAESFDQEFEFVERMKRQGWYLMDADRTLESAKHVARQINVGHQHVESYPTQAIVRVLPGQPRGGLRFGIFIKRKDGGAHHLANPLSENPKMLLRKGRAYVYHPTGWDVADPKVIRGVAIADGATVFIDERGLWGQKGSKLMFVGISDEHGNQMSVFPGSLTPTTKSSRKMWRVYGNVRGGGATTPTHFDEQITAATEHSARQIVVTMLSWKYPKARFEVSGSQEVGVPSTAGGYRLPNDPPAVVSRVDTVEDEDYGLEFHIHDRWIPKRDASRPRFAVEVWNMLEEPAVLVQTHEFEYRDDADDFVKSPAQWGVLSTRTNPPTTSNTKTLRLWKQHHHSGTAVRYLRHDAQGIHYEHKGSGSTPRHRDVISWKDAAAENALYEREAHGNPARPSRRGGMTRTKTEDERIQDESKLRSRWTATYKLSTGKGLLTLKLPVVDRKAARELVIKKMKRSGAKKGWIHSLVRDWDATPKKGWTPNPPDRDGGYDDPEVPLIYPEASRIEMVRGHGAYKGDKFYHKFPSRPQIRGLVAGARVNLPSGRTVVLPRRSVLVAGAKDLWKHFPV